MITLRSLAGLGCSLLALASAASCLDSSPVDYEAPADAGLSSDSSPADASKSDECRACFATSESPGPGCASDFTACIDDSKCAALIDCSLERRCLEQASLSARMDCSNPCLEASGITSFTDPSIMLSIPLQACSLAQCRAACVVE